MSKASELLSKIYEDGSSAGYYVISQKDHSRKGPIVDHLRAKLVLQNIVKKTGTPHYLTHKDDQGKTYEIDPITGTFKGQI
jgi:hypothetical protein